MIAGKRHGELATRIANDIKTERRIAAGLEAPWQAKTNMPIMMQDTPEARMRRKREGGTILVGRPAFKEYMAGLRRGWTESPAKIDAEEQLAKELENDNHFDEIEPPESPTVQVVDTSALADDEPIPTASRIPSSRPGMFSPISLRPPTSSTPSSPTPEKKDPVADIAPPVRIPPQPPLLLVPFVNHIGFTQIPYMFWEFFNERLKVKAGAEAAYRIIMKETEPFVAPATPFVSEHLPSDSSKPSSSTLGHLGFDAAAEAFYRPSAASIPSDIQSKREKFYKELPEKLATARALARREREPTKDELAVPPPTEVELRAERMKKELRWRADEKGWDIVRPGSPVEWDERMEGALRVFADPKRTGKDGEAEEAGGANIL